jgi:molybdate transport system permease protein
MSASYLEQGIAALGAAWIPLALTLKVALWASALNLLLGVALGAWMARSRWWARELLDAALTLPMVLPPTVLGYYLLVLIGREGPLGAWLLHWFGLQLIFTWQGAVIAAALVSFPLVYKAARAAFEGVDPQLEQAARLLGLSEPALFFRVSLPLAWRGVLSGLLLAFARATGEFGATLMVAGSIVGQTQTLSMAVFEAVQAGQDGQALWLVGLTSVSCLAVLLLAGRLAPGHVAGRPVEQR